MGSIRLAEPDLNLIREVKKAGGDTLNKCYQCATCSVVCNLSPSDKPFPRKEMLWTQWGQKEKLMKDPDIWLCHQCNDCTVHCPRGARPGDVLAAIRSNIYRSLAFPSFMGNALANPRALPILLMVPILLLLCCTILFAPTGANGDYIFLQSSQIDFNIFLPHSSVDGLFVFGNIIIFIFAAVSFSRFWKGLKSSGGETKLSFVGALIKVAKNIMSHSLFNKCDVNKPRAIGHLLLMYGFVGAMITTGAVFLSIFIPHYLELLGFDLFKSIFVLPLEILNPFKILGALSGFAILIGSVLLIFRRWANKDEVGANGYADYLFLYMFFFVGLTGMLSWLIRLAGIPMLAYANYFLHMVTVFFLLWYMPYSKFAHMIYRTLALIYARSIGREARL